MNDREHESFRARSIALRAVVLAAVGAVVVPRVTAFAQTRDVEARSSSAYVDDFEATWTFAGDGNRHRDGGTARSDVRHELRRTGIVVRVPAERLFHINGTPREDVVPSIQLDPMSGDTKDPLNAALEVLRFR